MEKQGKKGARFRVRVVSDVGKAERLINGSSESLSTKTRIRLSPTDSYLKEFRIMLVTGKDDRIAASCKARFVNGELLRRRGSVPCDVPDDLLPSEAFFDARNEDYVLQGTNFLQITDVYTLPEHQGEGMATWLASEVPELLSELYGLSFDYVIFPFSVTLFRSEDRVFGGDAAKKEAFLQARRKTASDILSKLGYRADLSGREPVFYKKLK